MACSSDSGGGSGCADCRPITAFDDTTVCDVVTEGYHYVAAPLPYSGAWPVGGEVERGVRQAVAEINAAGGVKGRPLGLILCETASDPVIASAIMADLAALPEVSATTCCMRSAEVADTQAVAIAEGLLMLSPGATSTAITGYADDGWINRTVPPDSIQGAVAANLAYGDGFRRVFVATLDDPYGTSLADVFIEEFERLGGETTQVIYAESLEEYTPPMTDVVQMARDYAPDMVYVAGLARDIGILLNVASDSDYQTEWLLPDGGRASEVVTAVANDSYLDSVRGTAPAPPSASFAQSYREEWGSDPQVFVATAYDAIYLLAASMELAENPDNRAQVRDALLTRTSSGTLVNVETAGWAGIAAEIAASGTFDYDGVSGPVDLDMAGDVRSNVEVWEIQSGEFQGIDCRTPDNQVCE